MTLIECLYEAREIDLIELPQHAERMCQHRLTLAIDGDPIKLSDLMVDGYPSIPKLFDLTVGNIADPFALRMKESSHVLEPHVTCFPFESRGLLFDIWVRWWWCEHMKQLTFCWPASLDENVRRFGMYKETLDFGEPNFYIEDALPMIRAYNAQMREAAGIKA